MRRAPPKKQHKLQADGLRLANLSVAVAQSSSRIEDIAWQAQLDTVVAKNLEHHHQNIIDAAAEHLFNAHPVAYEVLVETMESVSTSCRIQFQGRQYDVLLMAAPVLAWSRFEIASGAIPAATLEELSGIWKDGILTETTQLHILPNLVSIDQLPPTHSAAYTLMKTTAINLLKSNSNEPGGELPKTVPFLADIRYLMAVVVGPADVPLFCWQAIEAPFDCTQAKTDILTKWQTQAEAAMLRLLPGCGIELLLPEAFYSACREADIRIRPVSIRSAVFYLTHTLNVEASELGAIIAGFGLEENPGQIDEYRISFTLKKDPEVVYGVVWPLYQPDDQITAMGNTEDENLPGEIPSLLAECGITDVMRIDDIFGMEFCDDCSAPLFADRDSDLVHTEMPEDVPMQGTEHFH
jgi:hypothetical protein